MIDIEKRLADRMHAAVADEPPLGFDPDEVVDRAGRLRRRRSGYTAAGAATATAVLAVAAVTVLGNHDDVARNDVTRNTGTAAATAPAACQGTEIPPRFGGYAKLEDRMKRVLRPAVAAHLPGADVEPSQPVLAADCPPTVGAGFFVDDTAVELFLQHDRGELDDQQDRWADNPMFHKADEFTAEDGALIRVYEAGEGGKGGGRVVMRFGQDGMVAQAEIHPRTGVAVADLVELLGDPDLSFPVSQ
jgi:hypothetical protein